MSGRELRWQQTDIASTCENPIFIVQMEEESIGNNLLDLPSMHEGFSGSRVFTTRKWYVILDFKTCILRWSMT